MSNPSIWKSLKQVIPSVAGSSSGGAFAGERYYATLPDRFHGRFGAGNNGVWGHYFAGVPYGRLFPYEQFGTPALVELWSPFGFISETHFIGFAAIWDYNPLGYSPSWYQDLPTLIKLFDDGVTAPERWSWHPPYSRSDIQEGNQGWDYGISLLQRVLYDPRLRYNALYPSYTGYDILGTSIDNPVVSIVRPSSVDKWTIEQWPYGGTPIHTPLMNPDGVTGSPQYYSTGTRPCWIISAKPYVLNLQSPQEIIAAGHNGFPQSGIKKEVLFWFMPDLAGVDKKHPRVWMAQNWYKIDPDEVPSGHYFMGVPCMYWPPGLDYLQYALGPAEGDKDRFNDAVAYHYNNMPAAWNPSYPNSDTNPAIPQRTLDLHSGDDDDTSETAGNYTHIPSVCKSPHINLNPQFYLPYIEFERPDWIDQIPSGYAEIEDATAEVAITNCKRVEYRITWFHNQIKNTGDLHLPHLFTFAPGHYRVPGFLPFPNPGPNGFHLEQKSMISASADPGENNEEYRTIMKVTEVIGSDGSIIPDSDNTHIIKEDFEAYILATYGVTLNVTQIPGEASERNPPRHIPKMRPWLPYDDPNGPRSINTLQGAKVGHVLLGMQTWGEMVGREADDLTCPRSLKEMERNLLWHPDGQQYGGFAPSAESTVNEKYIEMLYKRGNYGEDYLRWLLACNSANVPDLENYRFRYLGKQRTNLNYSAGIKNVMPADGQYHTVEMTGIFQALLNDRTVTTNSPYEASFSKSHSKYRIYPSLPHWAKQLTQGPPPTYSSRSEDSFGKWEKSGINPYWLNASPFFGFQMPWNIAMVASGQVDNYWQTVWEDICFQSFESWHIKNLEAIISIPAIGVKIPVKIQTPWDD